MSDERRINSRLTSYWEALKKGNQIPSESDLEPDELKDVWDSCFLIEVRPEKNAGKYRFTYLGQSLIEAFSGDFKGLDMDEQIKKSYGVMMDSALTRMLSSKTPLEKEGEFINADNVTIKSRFCLLPLAGNGDFSYVLGGMKWRYF